jgi:hypothetical protein
MATCGVISEIAVPVPTSSRIFQTARVPECENAKIDEQKKALQRILGLIDAARIPEELRHLAIALLPDQYRRAFSSVS